jgi:hypothetical protein
MRRLHAAKNDLDWLPKNYRLLRGAVVGGVWATIGGGVAAMMFFGPHVYYFAGKALLGIGAGGYWVGDRVSKGIVKGRLTKLASGQVDLARLSNSEDGELVHVRGTVRATSKVASMLGSAGGVYRRVRASFGDLVMIDEEAVDFELVDAEGHAIIVETERARWLVHDRKLQTVSLHELGPFFVHDNVARVIESPKKFGFSMRPTTYRASEVMLHDGDEVEVVGYKSRRVDQSIVERLARETPMRATLRGGKELPVMISRVKEAS